MLDHCTHPDSGNDKNKSNVEILFEKLDMRKPNFQCDIYSLWHVLGLRFDNVIWIWSSKCWHCSLSTQWVRTGAFVLMRIFRGAQSVFLCYCPSYRIQFSQLSMHVFLSYEMWLFRKIVFSWFKAGIIKEVALLPISPFPSPLAVLDHFLI